MAGSLKSVKSVFAVAVGAYMNSVYKNVVKISMGHLIKEIRTVKWQNFPCNCFFSYYRPLNLGFMTSPKGCKHYN